MISAAVRAPPQDRQAGARQFLSSSGLSGRPELPGLFGPNRALDRFAQGAPTALRRFLEVLPALDLFGQALLFTQLLEPAEHLLHRLTSAGLDAYSHGTGALLQPNERSIRSKTIRLGKPQAKARSITCRHIEPRVLTRHPHSAGEASCMARGRRPARIGVGGGDHADLEDRLAQGDLMDHAQRSASRPARPGISDPPDSRSTRARRPRRPTRFPHW